MSEATLKLTRTWSGMAIGGQRERWNIEIDGTTAGDVADRETIEVTLPPGHHTLTLGSGRHRSRPRAFDVADGETVSFQCHGPRIWPLWVAALVKSDLWITLRRA